LEAKVESYTEQTIRAFAAAGLLPDLVQIGNEIDNGMLWPHGKVRGADAGGWGALGGLLKAGIRGARRAQPAARRVRVVLHTATGGLVRPNAEFLDRMDEHRVDFDVVGLSYYPWWHGTIDGLRENVRTIAVTRRKPVWVVETAYPWRPPSAASKTRDGTGAWPTSPEGQAAFLRDVARAVADAPEGRGLGVLWWYPESVPVPSTWTWCDGENALFDREGRALPALRMLAAPPPTPAAGPRQSTLQP
jgi:arabinogalactan endo-1,4-beta-galactosidase